MLNYGFDYFFSGVDDENILLCTHSFTAEVLLCVGEVQILLTLTWFYSLAAHHMGSSYYDAFVEMLVEYLKCVFHPRAGKCLDFFIVFSFRVAEMKNNRNSGHQVKLMSGLSYLKIKPESFMVHGEDKGSSLI